MGAMRGSMTPELGNAPFIHFSCLISSHHMHSQIRQICDGAVSMPGLTRPEQADIVPQL